MSDVRYLHETPRQAALRAAQTVIDQIEDVPPLVGWNGVIPGMQLRVAGQWHTVVTKHYGQHRILLDPEDIGSPWWYMPTEGEAFQPRWSF